MKKNTISIDILPRNPIILGFCYSNGRIINRDTDQEHYYEEYSIGLVFFSLNYMRVLT